MLRCGGSGVKQTGGGKSRWRQHQQLIGRTRTDPSLRACSASSSVYAALLVRLDKSAASTSQQKQCCMLTQSRVLCSLIRWEDRQR